MSKNVVILGKAGTNDTYIPFQLDNNGILYTQVSPNGNAGIIEGYSNELEGGQAINAINIAEGLNGLLTSSKIYAEGVSGNLIPLICDEEQRLRVDTGLTSIFISNTDLKVDITGLTSVYIANDPLNVNTGLTALYILNDYLICQIPDGITVNNTVSITGNVIEQNSGAILAGITGLENQLNTIINEGITVGITGTILEQNSTAILAGITGIESQFGYIIQNGFGITGIVSITGNVIEQNSGAILAGITGIESQLNTIITDGLTVGITGTILEQNSTAILAGITGLESQLDTIINEGITVGITGTILEQNSTAILAGITGLESQLNTIINDGLTVGITGAPFVKLEDGSGNLLTSSIVASSRGLDVSIIKSIGTNLQANNKVLTATEVGASKALDVYLTNTTAIATSNSVLTDAYDTTAEAIKTTLVNSGTITTQSNTYDGAGTNAITSTSGTGSKIGLDVNIINSSGITASISNSFLTVHNQVKHNSNWVDLVGASNGHLLVNSTTQDGEGNGIGSKQYTTGTGVANALSVNFASQEQNIDVNVLTIPGITASITGYSFTSLNNGTPIGASNSSLNCASLIYAVADLGGGTVGLTPIECEPVLSTGGIPKKNLLVYDRICGTTLDAINTKIGTSNTELNTINTSLITINSSITGLNTNLTTINSSITGLHTDLITINSSITGLQSSGVNINSGGTALTNTLGALNVNVQNSSIGITGGVQIKALNSSNALTNLICDSVGDLKIAISDSGNNTVLNTTATATPTQSTQILLPTTSTIMANTYNYSTNAYNTTSQQVKASVNNNNVVGLNVYPIIGKQKVYTLSGKYSNTTNRLLAGENSTATFSAVDWGILNGKSFFASMNGSSKVIFYDYVDINGNLGTGTITAPLSVWSAALPLQDGSSGVNKIVSILSTRATTNYTTTDTLFISRTTSSANTTNSGTYSDFFNSVFTVPNNCIMYITNIQSYCINPVALYLFKWDTITGARSTVWQQTYLSTISLSAGGDGNSGFGGVFTAGESFAFGGQGGNANDVVATVVMKYLY
jgi:hypothetical protein